MRLSSIKLSGFKSFVDTTHVQFPSNLSAVVGPNGSGKSNIIDAVRWVMGESSAKYLRGESMTDVIFNGSTNRKPVGQASIELIFDNSLGKLAGEFASYQEVSVKRLVTRDGQSNYFLNGQRCRKKDVTDLFLGTGLGPRSYAIIMQDTISRLIDAKPEELRIYLEEAAGISKYKERRRETELRMQHTRDNLDRLTDLRDELDKQLQHLQRQARAAERYKEFKATQRLTKAKLLTLKRSEFAKQNVSLIKQIEESETQLQKLIAQLRSIDAQYEALQEQHAIASDEYGREHELFYQLNAQLARLEQIKQHQQESLQKLQHEHAEAVQAVTYAMQALSTDENQLVEIQAQVEHLQPLAEELKESLIGEQQKLHALEQQLQDWQQQWDNFVAAASKHLQTAEVAQTQIQHLEQRKSDITNREQTLLQEQAQQNSIVVDELLLQLSEQIEERKLNQEEIIQQQQLLNEKIHEAQQVLRQMQMQINQLQAEHQQQQGRKASLEELQKSALGQNNSKVMEFLRQQGLADKQRLAELIEVQAPWDKAVELALQGYLDGVLVQDFNDVLNQLDKLESGHLCLIQQKNVNQLVKKAYPTLADFVVGDISIRYLLNDIYVAETIEEAKNRLVNLQANESIILKSGQWFSQSWLRVEKDKQVQSGILQRQQALNELYEQIQTSEFNLEELKQQFDSAQENLKELEQQKIYLVDAQRQLQQELSQIQAKQQIKLAEQQQLQARKEQLQKILSDLEQENLKLNADLKQAKTTWQEALQHSENDAAQRELLTSMREEVKLSLDAQKQLVYQQQQQAHNVAIELQSAKTKQQAIEQAKIRALQIQQQSQTKLLELEKQLSQLQEPMLQITEELQEKIEHKLQQESLVTEKKQRLELIENQIKSLQKERHQTEEANHAQRNGLEQLRMQEQTIIVKEANLTEQLAELDMQAEEIVLTDEDNISQLDQELIELEQKINRLGAINLAAIEEFQEISTRKTYLDAQNEDLVSALTMLENAIRKIDKETKDRFKETYELVNNHFQNLFPKIFGGGNAYLELTGDDLLETGVSVMARPPGKRNSTIHLLSGGEKALTALALVFSLFQLNPAPFCMLDEVDAPLDDANVGRYCSLVKEMSKTVQFIFISHNKLAIEMADHLTGVTMREPGVSRLVAVDVAQAVAMAEA